MEEQIPPETRYVVAKGLKMHATQVGCYDMTQERRAGRGQASSELVSRGRLCGGHLFLDDYGVNDGDLVHLVVGADDVG